MNKPPTKQQILEGLSKPDETWDAPTKQTTIGKYYPDEKTLYRFELAVAVGALNRAALNAEVINQIRRRGADKPFRFKAFGLQWRFEPEVE